MALRETRPVADALPPARRSAPSRLRLLGRAASITFTAPFAVGLFACWVTTVAVSPLTVVAPLVLPATWLVRRYADRYRCSVARLTGVPAPSAYRDGHGRDLIGRALIIVRDPASWRDARWLVVHAVASWFLATLSLGLVLGGAFYAVYPLLYRVTPHAVFGRPFGGVIELHSQAQSFWFVPLAVALFALWWAVSVPLARAEVALGRRLLTATR